MKKAWLGSILFILVCPFLLTAAEPTSPEGFLCVIPSRVAVGEPFEIKVKVIGPIHEVPPTFSWESDLRGGRLGGPFNVNYRNNRYLDNCLPRWIGQLRVDADGLDGPKELVFDGEHQGVFPGDVRPIKGFGGFRWTRPGIHFIKIVDPVSGVEGWSNAVSVTTEPPAERLWWGDIHCHTSCSDGLRIPEELYAFARDEAFLNFGALSDHMEAVSERQWDYFAAVTNDSNEPDRFATLLGQEWTSLPFGHRNIYYRGASGPVLRSNDPRYDSLDKLWAALDGIEAVVIPHHTASKSLGVHWEYGWDPRFEKAVEIYSAWGNSECPRDDGNLRPIVFMGGEAPGRHVIDALKKGFCFGFVGGGDIHDGRPGDDLMNRNFAEGYANLYPQGFTAVYAPRLTRENVYDAIKNHRTYATTKRRIYLRAEMSATGRLTIQAASEDGVREVVVVRGGKKVATVSPKSDPRIVDTSIDLPPLGTGEFCYVRVRTNDDNFAWMSPFYGESR